MQNEVATLATQALLNHEYRRWLFFLRSKSFFIYFYIEKYMVVWYTILEGGGCYKINLIDR